MKFVVSWLSVQDVFSLRVYPSRIAAVLIFLSPCLHVFYEPNIKQLTIQWVLVFEDPVLTVKHLCQCFLEISNLSTLVKFLCQQGCLHICTGKLIFLGGAEKRGKCFQNTPRVYIKIGYCEGIQAQNQIHWISFSLIQVEFILSLSLYNGLHWLPFIFNE